LYAQDENEEVVLMVTVQEQIERGETIRKAEAGMKKEIRLNRFQQVMKEIQRLRNMAGQPRKQPTVSPQYRKMLMQLQQQRNNPIKTRVIKRRINPQQRQYPPQRYQQMPQQQMPPQRQERTVFKSSGGSPMRPNYQRLPDDRNSQYYYDRDAFSGRVVIRKRQQAENWIRPKY
jgi:hypothetical protein